MGVAVRFFRFEVLFDVGLLAGLLGGEGGGCSMAPTTVGPFFLLLWTYYNSVMFSDAKTMKQGEW